MMRSNPLLRFNQYLQPMGLLLRVQFDCNLQHDINKVCYICDLLVLRRGPLPPEQLQLVEQNYDQYRETYDRH